MEPRPWVRDFAPVAGSFLACPLVALQGDAVAAEAVQRGRELADAERSVGLLFEPAVSGWAAEQGTLMAVAEVAYLGLHVPVMLGVLAWVYLLRPAAFPRLRTLFLAAQALTVAGWVAFPVAPPHLLDEGAARAAAPPWSALLQSQYAAMPSGHVAFALIAGGAVALLARAPLARLAGAAYPPTVVALTVLTANHFWLDAVGGLAVVGVAGLVASGVRRLPRPTRAALAEPG